MASKPGNLTEWPWKHLGSFKCARFGAQCEVKETCFGALINIISLYSILSPWVVHCVYSSFTVEDDRKKDIFKLLIFPVMIMWRILHNQIWISLSRYMTAKGTNRILDKAIEFDQVDRESNWDDQIVMSGLMMYVVNSTIEGASQLPLWSTDGIFLTVLIHIGPVEFLYYWFHRALHHHYLYSRYHSHHHFSVATQPITSVIHPFAEVMVYLILFAIPLMATAFTRTGSIVGVFGYITYIDFMNNMGHCNFELIPKQIFSIFPPIKYLMYTPSYHSLHHTQFRTNYSLFMPFYDYLYNTMDKSSDEVYEKSLQRQQDSPDVVHLTHLTTLESIYHLPIGFASMASKPQASKWYLWLIWPLSCWSMMLTRFFNHSIVVERNTFEKLKLQTWVMPVYNIQYSLPSQKSKTNRMIEEGILEADRRGIKVLSLGLSNQGKELNSHGELYVRRNPNLKIKIVDGSSLAVDVVLHSIPKGSTQVLLRGNLSKVAYAIALSLCQRGIQVITAKEDEYANISSKIPKEFGSNLILTKTCTQKVWIVGDGLTKEEQSKALKGTLFIPFSQFPPKNKRGDCLYYDTPSMISPPALQNMISCENWLPRKVMSAWRVAGIVHALEGWKVHECGDNTYDIDKFWHASLSHGFLPPCYPRPV